MVFNYIYVVPNDSINLWKSYFMACSIDVYENYMTIVYTNHFGSLINIKVLTFYADSI